MIRNPQWKVNGECHSGRLPDRGMLLKTSGVGLIRSTDARTERRARHLGRRALKAATIRHSGYARNSSVVPIVESARAGELHCKEGSFRVFFSGVRTCAHRCLV
jgi:hypothetical protein